MTTDELHRRARQLAAQQNISLPAALAQLGRRGAIKRNYGTHRIRTDQFAHVESPKRSFWWQKEVQ